MPTLQRAEVKDSKQRAHKEAVVSTSLSLEITAINDAILWNCGHNSTTCAVVSKELSEQV